MNINKIIFRELHTLYEQYLESRIKYFFYRERLEKELKIQPGYVAPVLISTDPNAPIHLGRVDLTKKVASLPTPARKLIYNFLKFFLAINYLGTQRIAPVNLTPYSYCNNMAPVNGYLFE